MNITRIQPAGSKALNRLTEAVQLAVRKALVEVGSNRGVVCCSSGEDFCCQPAPQLIAGAGHFLQEDQGEQVGAQIAGWLAGTR